MSVTPLSSSGVKSEVYEILRAAYHDAAELISYKDDAVALKGERIKRSVNECLDYVRKISAGPMTNLPNFVSNGAFAQRVIMRACLLDESMIDAAPVINIDCDPAVVLKHHAAAYSLILRELCQNAMSAVEGRNDPRIDISLTFKGALVRTVVEDNGPGLSNDVLDALFPTVLTRGNDPSHMPLGKGLSIAIQTARSIDAELSLLWNSEQGAAFCLTQPAEHFRRSAASSFPTSSEKAGKIADIGWAPKD